MMVRLFTAAKLVLPNFSRLHPSIPSIYLEQRYIPIFSSTDLNKKANLHCSCCHCQVARRSSFLLVFNQALTVQYSVFNKTQIKYIKYFITINYFWRKQNSLARF